MRERDREDNVDVERVGDAREGKAEEGDCAVYTFLVSGQSVNATWAEEVREERTAVTC